MFDKNQVPPTAWVIGGAVGLGGLARVLVGVCTSSTGVGTKIAFGVLGAVVGAPLVVLFGVMGSVLVRVQVRQLRALAAEHPVSARRAWWALAAFAAVLVVSAIVAIAAHGTGPGAAAWLLTRLLVAVLIGGGTTIMAFWPYLFGPADLRRARYCVAAGIITVGAFLLSAGQDEAGIGIGVLTLFGVTLAGYVKGGANLFRRDRTPFAGGVLGVLYLACLCLLWLNIASDPASSGPVARFAVQFVIAAVLGTIVAPMIWRRTRTSRPVVRRLGTAATVLMSGYLVFLVLDDQMLGGALVAPLFPVVIWLGIRLWRRMGGDRRIGVKAAADVAFALVLGAVLVSFLAWLANLLALSPDEAQALKEVAAATHDALELSPWIWFGIYAVLAAVQLLAALGPKKYQFLSRRLASLRVVPTVTVVHRSATMAGIALMVVALLGLAVPPTSGPVLRRQIQIAYTVAAQEELKDEEEIAVYQAITAGLTRSRPQLVFLVDLVTDVHVTAGGKTTTESDLAHRLGLLQGQVIASKQGPVEPPAAPRLDGGTLQQQLDAEQHEDTLKQARDKQAESAADLGANTVTSLLDLISIGHAEVLSIVHEYINGLAESPLGEIFLDWAKRALNKLQPSTATDVVEPDPTALAKAAAAQADLASAQDLPSDLRLPDLPPIPGQPAEEIQEAVSAESQTATLDQQHAQCPGCGVSDNGPGDDEPGHDEPGHEAPPVEVHGGG